MGKYDTGGVGSWQSQLAVAVAVGSRSWQSQSQLQLAARRFTLVTLIIVILQFQTVDFKLYHLIDELLVFPVIPVFQKLNKVPIGVNTEGL